MWFLMGGKKKNPVVTIVLLYNYYIISLNKNNFNDSNNKILAKNYMYVFDSFEFLFF